jgi:release factor glutamine methyltransferase
MTVRDAIAKYRSELNSLYAPGELNEIISLVLESVKGFSKTDMITKDNISLNDDEVVQLQGILSELKTNKPVQYVLGYSWFYGMKLKVNHDVLIPRPETEELVRWIIEDYKSTFPIRVLDIGTGSGCIPIALKKHISNAEVIAIDVSESALEVAKENARVHHVDIQFIQQDILRWKDSDEQLQTPFDIIVSNPPYVLQSDKSSLQERVLKYEPHLALFTGTEDDLIFYRSIADYAFRNLVPDGILYLEIHERKGDDVRALLAAKGFSSVELREDMSGKERMVKAVSNGNQMAF